MDSNITLTCCNSNFLEENCHPDTVLLHFICDDFYFSIIITRVIIFLKEIAVLHVSV